MLYILLGYNTVNTAEYASPSTSILRQCFPCAFTATLYPSQICGDHMTQAYGHFYHPSSYIRFRVVLTPQSIISDWGEPLTFQKLHLLISHSLLFRLPFYTLAESRHEHITPSYTVPVGLFQINAQCEDSLSYLKRPGLLQFVKTTWPSDNWTTKQRWKQSAALTKS